MEENFDALEVIARTRGKVRMDDAPTGENIFLIWGWATALFFLLEFVLWQLFGQEWCLWLWVGIPLVGTPLMMRCMRRDHKRTHTRTRQAKIILDYWMFVGAASCVSGFVMGFAGLYEVAFLPLVCLLIGIGCFLTGEVLRFRPKIGCGLAGCVLAVAAFLFQGELWPWQLLAVSLVSVVSLIIPGYLYNKAVAEKTIE